jgi:glyoxylase-like metal-dependent hydrolase (beta-lactamase superfamily II)
MLNYRSSPGAKGLIECWIETVTSRVGRVPLPLPLSDLRVVNVYAIRADDGVTLVDSGWADEPSESVIIEALRGLGFVPGDARRILVTHAHWDHFSRAILWQRRYGTTVLLGRQEHHTIEAFDQIDGFVVGGLRLRCGRRFGSVGQLLRAAATRGGSSIIIIIGYHRGCRF